jgi:hypothetical protein
MLKLIDVKANNLMKNFVKFLLASATLVACVLVAPQAKALTFDETTDIGQLLGDAQNVGSASEINGAVGVFDDIDLFKLTIAQDGMSTFDASPIRSEDGSQLNINIFLFNAMGNPLASIEPRELDNMIINFNTTAGDYFLGIGSDDLDALDALGNQIAGNDSGIDMADGVLGGWQTGSESIGKYNIKISTVPTDAVPTPALLPGLIALGAKAMRKKKQGEAALSEVAVEA